MKLIIKIFTGYLFVCYSTIFGQTTHFSFTSGTGNNATVLIQTSANPNINGVTLANGDEIGAFTPSGLCVGAVIWNNSNTTITVWGDNDQTTEVDGLLAGELIEFRVWDQSENIEYFNVNVTFDSNPPFVATGLFTVNGLYSLISLTATPSIQPSITASPTSLEDFGNVIINTNSVTKSYIVSGSNLTADIVVTAPSGFEISKDTITFSNTVTLTQVGGFISNTTIYVRFKPTAVLVYTGNITNTSSGAAANNVSVRGTGVDIPNISLSPSDQVVTYTTGSTTISVTSNTNWSVSDDALWLAVYPTNGSNNGTITATYTENTSINQRVATITVVGGDVIKYATVTQNRGAGQTPIITVQPQNQTVIKGQTATFSVTATCLDSIGYQWWRVPYTGPESQIVNIPDRIEGATSNQLKILNTIQTDNGTQYLCEVYNTYDHQNAWVNSNTVALKVNYLKVDTSSKNINYQSGSTSFAITSNMSWSVIADATWLTVSPTNGSNNGTLTATYEENTSPSERIGTITVFSSGITIKITITQGSAPFTLTVNPSNRPVASTDGNTTFSLTSNTSWSITDDADWLTVIPISGGGNGTITAIYTENSSASQRVGTITINGGGITRTVTVTQDIPTAIEITLIPSNQDVAYTAGTATFSITSNTNWSANDDADWLTVLPTSGSNNDSLRSTFAENTTTVQRVATITVTGGGILRTATITQGAAPFMLIVSPIDRPVAYTSGSTTFSLLSNAGWSISNDADWLVISPTSGNNNGTLTATYAENTMANQRVGTMTVLGIGITKSVTVTQNAAPAELTVSPTDRYVAYTAGITTFNVTSNTTWLVSDDADWLTVAPDSGSGNETLIATFEENSTAIQRVGTITVSGGGIVSSVKVRQEGSTGIEDLKYINSVPTDYMLLNNYPNPFNPSTYIEFGIPEEATTQLKVYDIIGNEIATLLENETLHAGKYRYELKADNLTSGIYIYVLLSQSNISKESFRALKKMILLK